MVAANHFGRGILLNASSVTAAQTSQIFQDHRHGVRKTVVCVHSTQDCTAAGAGAPLVIEVEDPTTENDGQVNLTGAINTTASTAVVGVGTLFSSELAVNDVLIVNGHRRIVTAITDNTNLTVNKAFEDMANDTSPLRERYSGFALTTVDITANTLEKVIIDAGAGSRIRCTIQPDASADVKIWAWSSD